MLLAVPLGNCSVLRCKKSASSPDKSPPPLFSRNEVEPNKGRLAISKQHLVLLPRCTRAFKVCAVNFHLTTLPPDAVLMREFIKAAGHLCLLSSHLLSIRSRCTRLDGVSVCSRSAFSRTQAARTIDSTAPPLKKRAGLNDCRKRQLRANELKKQGDARIGFENLKHTGKVTGKPPPES